MDYITNWMPCSWYTDHLTAKFWTSPFLSSTNLRILWTTCIKTMELICVNFFSSWSYFTFRSLSSSNLMESFCSSTIKSFVAINRKSLSMDIIWEWLKWQYFVQKFLLTLSSKVDMWYGDVIVTLALIQPLQKVLLDGNILVCKSQCNKQLSKSYLLTSLTERSSRVP